MVWIHFRHYKNCPGYDLKKSIENRGIFCENKYNETKSKTSGKPKDTIKERKKDKKGYEKRKKEQVKKEQQRLLWEGKRNESSCKVSNKKL